MHLTPGTKLGSYEIVAPIGAGGMGEVYRARDTKLKRDVAVKVLPASVAMDAERLGRFQREAEILASLNHPGIAGIYGLVDNALVMELVEGETLPCPLPVETAIAYARQIADALEYAHDRGVIHRDLKPANIKVTPEGVIKVLDFGLAKALDERPAASGDPANSPTLTMHATAAGMILGTAAYMSPEQAVGKSADRRSDIFSFGAVLYEMLAGKRAFGGDSAGETLASIVKDQPDWSALPSATPPGVRNLLERALSKDRRQRLQAIGEARIVLEQGGTEVSLPAVGPLEETDARPAALGRPVLVWVAVALFAAAAVLGFMAYRRFTGTVPEVLNVSVNLPEDAEFGASPPAVSPDGRRIAFVARISGRDLLLVRDLDALSPRALMGTEGADHPFWSPDSRFVAFFAGDKLKKIDAAGGPPLTICDGISAARGGSWGIRDVILFTPSPASGIFRVPATGASPALVKRPARFPWFLPDGRHFLYTAGLQGALYFADLDSKAEQRVLTADTNALYAPPGYLLFMREGALLAQPFNASSGKTTGEAVPVTEHVGSFVTNSQGQFSASQGLADRALLAYTSGTRFEVQLTWYDRTGKVVGTLGHPGGSLRPSVSPDGSMVAVDRADPQTGVMDVWLLNVVRGSETRLTFRQPRNLLPVWSPDGRQIAFNSMRNLSRRAVSGSGRNGSEELLDSPHGGEARIIPLDWTRDGRYIVEQIVDDPKTKTDIWVLPLTGDQKAFPYLRTESNEAAARVSPNGRWLAYASDESKRFEIYVQSFPSPGSKFQASIDGGTLPVWSHDGKELFFIAPDGKMMAAAVKGAAVGDPGAFDAGKPTVLFDARIPAEIAARYDVSQDGRFLIPTPIKAAAGQQITVVVNWVAALKK